MDTQLTLPDELHNAARDLGQTLRQDNFIRTYLDAVAAFQADPQAVDLEKKMYSLYEQFIARQQAGETLSQEELKPFYELRRQVQSHPLISMRENTLRLIKPHLAEIADEISAALGVDYTTLARSPQKIGD